VRKLDGTYEVMTYNKYEEKKKRGEVKDKKYLIDVDPAPAPAPASAEERGDEAPVLQAP